MVTELVVALTGVLSSLITFVLTKRKYNAEVDSSVVENLKNSLDFYIKLCDDTSNRLDEYERENEDLRHQLAELKSQVIGMMGTICYNTSCRNREIIN